jgi:surfactin synthase thioesterase subunit
MKAVMFVRLGAARPDAPRLYCFAHAGGSVAEFARWSETFPDMEIWGAALPGRGSRMTEPVVPDVLGIASMAAAEIDTAQPYVLLGHSFGALVAFETFRAIRRDPPRRLPEALVVSAFSAPDEVDRLEDLHTLGDIDLLTRLADRFGAIPPEILGHPELRGLVAANLRADFEAINGYRHHPSPKVNVPVLLLLPADDQSTVSIPAWQGHACGGFTVHQFPGDHFYLRETTNLSTIARLVRQVSGLGEMTRDGEGVAQ